MHDKNIAPLKFRTPNTSVIYVRCWDDTLLRHPEYGPTGFSLYNDAKYSTDILVLQGRGLTELDSHTRSLCGQIEPARLAYLHKLNPKANITVVSNSVFEDFRLLVHAPDLYLDVSTYGLIAGMANTGSVHLTPMFGTQFESPGFHWSDAAVLLPDVAEIELNFSCHSHCKNTPKCYCNNAAEGPTSVTHDEMQRMIHWLETH